LRVCPADWSEQEVSELRRIARVLQRAGLATEISYGLSDEGDPWCVICQMGSITVLAHFARIDGSYVGYWEDSGSKRSGDRLRLVADQFLRSYWKECVS
jgi:hypothetical protein